MLNSLNWLVGSSICDINQNKFSIYNLYCTIRVDSVDFTGLQIIGFLNFLLQDKICIVSPTVTLLYSILDLLCFCCIN